MMSLSTEHFTAFLDAWRFDLDFAEGAELARLSQDLPGILATEYPTLAAFHARVEARPNIAKWIASEDPAKIFAFPAL